MTSASGSSSGSSGARIASTNAAPSAITLSTSAAPQRDPGRQHAGGQHAAAARPARRRAVGAIGLEIEEVVRVVGHELRRGHAELPPGEPRRIERGARRRGQRGARARRTRTRRRETCGRPSLMNARIARASRATPRIVLGLLLRAAATHAASAGLRLEGAHPVRARRQRAHPGSARATPRRSGAAAT